MYEIELKAHVYERQKTIDLLNSFANFKGKVERYDTYYKMPKKKNKKDTVSARIRKEIIENKESFVLTYKKKEMRVSSDGRQTEVNDEKECILSNFEAVESLFFDVGFEQSLKKEKIVYCWTFLTPFGNANLELCTIKGLGDFLEIEILSERNDVSYTEKVQKELYNLLDRVDIPHSVIENRYYSTLLKAKEV